MDADAVAAARRLAGEVLAPAAQRVDRDGLPRTHLQALAGSGLLGLRVPAAYGGLEAPEPVRRQVAEILSGACGTTWFVWTQHHTPVAALERSPNRDLAEQWLPRFARDTLSGIGISQLRRRDDPPVTAHRVEGGWRVDGLVPWFTSWGYAEVLLLGARLDRGAAGRAQNLLALVPARESPELRHTGLLPLVAMQSTATTQLRLDGLRISDRDVVDVVDADDWDTEDLAKTSNAAPALFGLTFAALDALSALAARRDDARAGELAETLRAEADEVRAAAYRLVDEVPAGQLLEERLALRTEAMALAVRVTTALVAAGGGASMSLDNPAQRWAREALFHLIQAQTARVRGATLERWLQGALRRTT